MAKQSLLSRAKSFGDWALSSSPKQSRGFESLETGSGPPSADLLLRMFGLGVDGDVIVDVNKALSLPAVWAAVNFLSGTLAGLPLHAFKKTKTGPERTPGAIDALLNHAASDDQTAYELRRWIYDRVLTKGRAYVYIERDARGNPVNLFPMLPEKTKPVRQNGQKRYLYDNGEGREMLNYAAADVIDIAFMMGADGLSYYSPINACANAIASAISAQTYGSKIFRNGGLPVFVIEGPIVSAAASRRVEEDITQAAADAFTSGKSAMALPEGHKITQLAVDPMKLQMVDFRRFLIEEVARIYQLPPVFVQDLTHGTFSNTEQQDLHLTKHVITRWTSQVESELNFKLFGRANGRSSVMKYVEHNMDGLLRGDFKTRMEGYAIGIQNGFKTPNQIRKMENDPELPDGDDLMIQGATVPLKNQKNVVPGAPAAPTADPVKK